jgi:hypothetical protein
MTNKQDNYPITLQQAKKIARIRLGHPLRIGYSIVVGGVYKQNEMYPEFREWYYMLELSRDVKGYWLHCWQKYNGCDMSEFRTIEFEHDTRRMLYHK